MKTRKILTLFFLFNGLFLSAQVLTLIPDKIGTFKVINSSFLSFDVSRYGKPMLDASFQKLISVGNAVRKNPLISGMKGFDCDARVLGADFRQRNGYGIPSVMVFNFCCWYLEKGKVIRWNIEPPHWDILINQLNPFQAEGVFLYTSNKPWQNIRKGFNYELWVKSAENIREIFFQPGKKENIGRGIDRYNDETIVIFNPDREPYWIPVTVREAFNLIIQYWELCPNQAQVDFIGKQLRDEYAGFSESERDEYAHIDARSPISSIGIDKSGFPLMRANPAYWNKNLPPSAVQIISFFYPADKSYLKNEMEEQLKNNDGTYYRTQFVETLDINTLLPIIDK